MNIHLFHDEDNLVALEKVGMGLRWEGRGERGREGGRGEEGGGEKKKKERRGDEKGRGRKLGGNWKMTAYYD